MHRKLIDYRIRSHAWLSDAATIDLLLFPHREDMYLTSCLTADTQRISLTYLQSFFRKICR